MRSPSFALLGALLVGCGEESERPADGSRAPCTTQAWFYDADGDGFGAAERAIEACDPPDGYVAEPGDCDDISDRVHPGAKDECGDGLDADCDGEDPACALAESGPIPTPLLVGELDGDAAGATLANAGDIDGDGWADLLVGAPKRAGGGGGFYAVSGPVTGEMPLHEADYVHEGGFTSGGLGSSLAALGDVDGDGFDDVAVGAPYDMQIGDGSGRAWIFLGPLSGTTGSGMGGYTLSAETGAWEAGTAVVGGGDLTGDGVGDLLVGTDDTAAVGAVGRLYVAPMPPSAGEPGQLGTHAWALEGEQENSAAGAAAALGDVDGDGIADILTSAAMHDGTRGRAYLLHGPVTAAGQLADADAILDGEEAGGALGAFLHIADLDGDGRGEPIVAAPAAGAGDGAVWVLGPGARGTIGSAASLARIDGAGVSSLGTALDAGDIDGDGVVDLLIGAATLDGGSGGVVALLGPVSGTRSVESAERTWKGAAAGDQPGTALAVGPDLSGDGYGDILIGLPGHAAGAARGAVAIVPGAVR